MHVIPFKQQQLFHPTHTHTWLECILLTLCLTLQFPVIKVPKYFFFLSSYSHSLLFLFTASIDQESYLLLLSLSPSYNYTNGHFNCEARVTLKGKFNYHSEVAIYTNFLLWTFIWLKQFLFFTFTLLVTVSVSGSGNTMSSSKFEPPSRPNSYWDEPHFRPYFDETLPRNVTVQLGKTAHLPCQIRLLADRTVSIVELVFFSSLFANNFALSVSFIWLSESFSCRFWSVHKWTLDG